MYQNVQWQCNCRLYYIKQQLPCLVPKSVTQRQYPLHFQPLFLSLARLSPVTWFSAGNMGFEASGNVTDIVHGVQEMCVRNKVLRRNENFCNVFHVVLLSKRYHFLDISRRSFGKNFSEHEFFSLKVSDDTQTFPASWGFSSVIL
jgi:hypothetical protein